MSRIAWHLVLALAALAVAACGQPAQVEIVNQSGAVLGDVLVVANGAAVSIGNLTPREQRRIALCPSSGSSLQLQFIARGRPYQIPAATYLECSNEYRLRVEVARDLSAHARYLVAPPGHR